MARTQPLTKTNAELLRDVRLLGAAGFTGMLLLLAADDAVDLWRHRTVRAWELAELAIGVAIGLLTLTLARWLTQRITLLEGLVSICMHCKRVRTDAGWVSIERFVSTRSDARFSHGLCPACFEQEHGGASGPLGARTRTDGSPG